MRDRQLDEFEQKETVNKYETAELERTHSELLSSVDEMRRENDALARARRPAETLLVFNQRARARERGDIQSPLSCSFVLVLPSFHTVQKGDVCVRAIVSLAESLSRERSVCFARSWSHTLEEPQVKPELHKLEKELLSAQQQFKSHAPRVARRKFQSSSSQSCD